MSDVLLSVTNLRSWLFTDHGAAKAVDGVSFDVHPGETLGIVGESGCGKTVTSLSVLGLLPQPPARIMEESSIRFRGEELVGANEPRLRSLRGKEISMIFQEPMGSLNPVYSVGEQVSEVLRLHRGLGSLVPRGWDRRCGCAARRVSAPIVRRDATTRDDRDGALMRAGPADRR